MSEIHSKDHSTSKPSAQLSHQSAAEHHELAATHHKAAASKLAMGDHEAAAHHSLLAHSHAGQAKDDSNRASRQYASAHEPKKVD